MISSPFDSIKRIDIHNQDFWSARELYPLLGYTNWNKFQDVIQRSKDAISASGTSIDDHFYPEVKLISAGKGAQRPVEDYKLSRRACYQIAMNGNPKKEQVALAQMYFASQTRKQELYQEYLSDKERLKERIEYSKTDKELSGALTEKGLKSPQIAGVKAKGQRAFYHAEPDMIRNKYGIKGKKPIVDKAPQILITAQSLANQMTAMNVGKSRILNSENAISREHVTNNSSVRNTLIDRGIVPESLPPEEDTKKLPRKIQTFEEGLGKNLIE